jgi:hypothetical protein
VVYLEEVAVGFVENLQEELALSLSRAETF